MQKTLEDIRAAVIRKIVDQVWPLVLSFMGGAGDEAGGRAEHRVSATWLKGKKID